MSNPRANIEDLKLTGSPNIKRALKYSPEKQLAKREELEAMFADIQERRREALADVTKNGIIINQEKSNSRGMIYLQRITNPALTIARQCEMQLASLARLLVVDAPTGKKTTAELLAAADEALRAN
jgi:phage terminase small subunit